MSTITFDTLKFAERLEKAGLTREQASAIAEAQKDALDTTLAMKADIAEVKAELALLNMKQKHRQKQRIKGIKGARVN